MRPHSRNSGVSCTTRIAFDTGQRLSEGDVDTWTVSGLLVRLRGIDTHTVRLISRNGTQRIVPIDLPPGNFELELSAAGKTGRHGCAVRCPRESFSFGNRIRITKNVSSVSLIVAPIDDSNNNNGNGSPFPLLFRPINGNYSLVGLAGFIGRS